MKKINKEYFGKKIMVVNAINISQVKYVYKVDKQKFKFNLLVIGFIFIICFNLIGILKNVSKII